MVSEAELPYLRRCVELAAEALEAGDEPFGSVLVGADGAVLAEDHNRVASGDRTRHPEFALARWAAERLSPEQRAAGSGDGVHVRRTLPDVRGRARLGRPRPHRVRGVVRAARLMAGGAGRTGTSGAGVAGARGGARRDRGGTRSRAHRRDTGAAPPLPRRAGLSRAPNRGQVTGALGAGPHRRSPPMGPPSQLPRAAPREPEGPAPPMAITTDGASPVPRAAHGRPTKQLGDPARATRSRQATPARRPCPRRAGHDAPGGLGTRVTTRDAGSAGRRA